MEIYDEYNNFVDTENMEVEEQKLAKYYILPDDVVLELGGRYGSVSCIINSKLNNKTNEVVVEPDQRVWDALEKNRNRNNCQFHIVKGFISNKKLDLTNLDDYHGGYGSTFIENNESKIPSYSLSEIKQKYKLNFNVLVADCEGFLEVFFDENPDIYQDLRLIIFEADYCDKCDYAKIKNNLRDKGFRCLLDSHQNVWIKKPPIYYSLIHCIEHSSRDYYIDIIREWLGKPVEVLKGVYSKYINLSLSLEYMQTFNPNFKFDENSNFRFVLPGEIGCYLSHFKFIEKILNNYKNNLFVNDYSVVFEDDVAFDRNLHDEIEQIIINIETKQIDFDIIFLGNLNDNCGEYVVHNVYKINNYQECWGTHALLIKNKNIEKIYNSLLNIRAQIDIHYASLIKDQTLNGFVIFPSICRQKDDFNSTIK